MKIGELPRGLLMRLLRGLLMRLPRGLLMRLPMRLSRGQIFFKVDMIINL